MVQLMSQSMIGLVFIVYKVEHLKSNMSKKNYL